MDHDPPSSRLTRLHPLLLHQFILDKLSGFSVRNYNYLVESLGVIMAMLMCIDPNVCVVFLFRH